jgi:ubiquinone/menaquinone biosynthesis C-methylase UbiE
MTDGSVAGVFSSHFFEHVTDVPALMREVTRVVAPGGRIEIVVPHFSNAYFYSDPTHRTAFGLYSMAYFVEETPFRREVPVYGDALPLELLDVTLRFKTSPPFYVRYVARRAVEWMVNRSRWAQEFYEDNLTWIIPCYELRFELRRALTGDVPSAGASTG